MFTIRTAYKGPTDTSGSKIVATGKTAQGKRRQKSIPYPYALSGVDPHLAAVVAFMEVDGPIHRASIDLIDKIVLTGHQTGYDFTFHVSL